MAHVALMFGERPEVACTLPFSVDGMMLVASIVMVDDKRRDHRVRPTARIAFAAGVLASVAANIAAAHPSIGARIVAAWPAIALLLVVEMLARPPVPAAGRRPVTAAGRPAAADGVVAPAAAEVPAEVPPAPPSARSAGTEGTARGHAQPPAASSLVHTTSAEPASTAEPAGPAAGGRNGDAVARPAAATAPHPALRTPNTAPVPTPMPYAAGPYAADGPPEPAPRRPGGGDVPEAEPARAQASSGRQVPAAAARSAVNRRRPAAATRQLARQIIETEPHLSRTEIAARLGVSTRRLREVLATPHSRRHRNPDARPAAGTSHAHGHGRNKHPAADLSQRITAGRTPVICEP